MAEWDKEYDLEGMDKDFVAIRFLFISGHIKSMIQLEKQSPSKVARLLGLQYNSYHDKLKAPELFTEKHINILAYACRLDPNMIHDVIQVEIRSRIESATQAFYIKEKEAKSKSLDK